MAAGLTEIFVARIRLNDGPVLTYQVAFLQRWRVGRVDVIVIKIFQFLLYRTREYGPVRNTKGQFRVAEVYTEFNLCDKISRTRVPVERKIGASRSPPRGRSAGSYASKRPFNRERFYTTRRYYCARARDCTTSAIRTFVRTFLAYKSNREPLIPKKRTSFSRVSRFCFSLFYYYRRVSNCCT